MRIPSQRQSSNCKRPVLHLVDRADQFPEGVIPNRVILHTELELRFQRTLHGRSHLAVVQANFFCEGSGLPAMQTSRKYSDVIDASTLQRHISADRLVAVSAKKLTPTPDILDIRESVVVLEIAFAKWRSCHTDLRILAHSLDQKLEVARLRKLTSASRLPMTSTFSVSAAARNLH